MTQQDLDTPDIGLTLLQQAMLLQKGRKITRGSKKEVTEECFPLLVEQDNSDNYGSQHRKMFPTQHPAKKTKHGKSYEQSSKQLLRYTGQPNLKNYLSRKSINNYQQPRNKYLLARNLKLLNKQHLPQCCFFLEKSLILDTFELKSVKINTKKGKQTGFLVQETGNSGSISRYVVEDIGYLSVGQTIVFHYINFQSFKHLFANELEQLTGQYAAIRKQTSGISIEGNYQSMDIHEIPLRSFHELLDNSVKSSELEASLRPLTNEDAMVGSLSYFPESVQLHKTYPDSIFQQQIQPSEIQNCQLILKQIPLTVKIFNKLAVAQLDLILWPAIVLQGLNCDPETLNHVIQKKTIFRNQAKHKSLLRMVFEEIVAEQRSQHYDQKQFSRKSQFSEQKLAKLTALMANQRQDRQERHDPVCLYLLQTSKLLTTNSIFLWSQFQPNELRWLIRNTNFYPFLDDINSIIECFNKLKSLQYSQLKPQDHRAYFNRISSYFHQSSSQEQLCIPIRYDNSHGQKKVLILILRDDQINQQIHKPKLMWVPIDRIQANYTLPKSNNEQSRFYYLIDKHISVSQALNYVLSNFYYQPLQYRSVLRKYYPQTPIIKSDPRYQRCIYCNYTLYKHPYIQCMFCNKICHKQCVSINLKQSSQQNISIYDDKYNHQDTSDNQQYLNWNCEACQPCSQCHQAVKQDYLKCVKCKQLFHQICGKLKGVQNGALLGEKYTCQSCLKCKICQNKLKNKQYCLQEREIFCVNCDKVFKNNQYCIICVKESAEKCTWVSCDRQNCNRWVHAKCDPFLMDKQIALIDIDKVKYECPNCRKDKRRKIGYRIINQLKCFDEYQYFTSAGYEYLIDYKSIIKQPICIETMNQKVIEGQYDQQMYKKIKDDFSLIISNALTYNMPKDQPSYRAKILNIVGLKAIQYFREILECPDDQLIHKDIHSWIQTRRKQLYHYIYSNYLQMLLNFNSKSSYATIKKIPHQLADLPDKPYFSSRQILNKIYSDVQIKFTIKKKCKKIQNLFTNPKLEPAFWTHIDSNRCFYHTNSNRPIISSCDICCESYCCTLVCFKHRICTVCGVKGCACDTYQCGCQTIRERDRKQFEKKIFTLFPKLSKRAITQNFKYCMKCVSEKMKSHNCFLCNQYCLFDYEKCEECQKVYHNSCEQKSRQQLLSNIIIGNLQAWRSIRLPSLCISCSFSSKHLIEIKQLQNKKVKLESTQLMSISRYLHVLQYVFEINNLRLTEDKIVTLVKKNYQQFTARSHIYEEVSDNFVAVTSIYSDMRRYEMEFWKNIDLFMPKIKTIQRGGSDLSKQIHSITNMFRVEQRCQQLMIKHFNWQIVERKQSLTQFIYKDELSSIEYLKYSLELSSNTLLNDRSCLEICEDILATIFLPEQQHTNVQVDNILKQQSNIILPPHYIVIPKSSPTIICSDVSRILYTTFSSQLEIYRQPIKHFPNSWLYRFTRVKKLLNSLSHFSRRIFQNSKTVLRLGSTCILRQLKQGQTSWRILKKWANKTYEIQLDQCQGLWRLTIGTQRFLINTIEQLQNKIQSLSPNVNTFQQLATFLGFTFSDQTYYQSLHFTNLLQTTPMDTISRTKRTKLVQQVYNKYNWQPQGISSHCLVQADGIPKIYKYSMTKKNLYYLQKRSKKQVETGDNGTTPPYITLEDLKRDLEDPGQTNASKNNNFIFQQPINEVYIAPSKIHKLGLFLRKSVRKNTVVVEYIGEIVNEAVADLRQTVFRFGCYMFSLNRRSIQRSEIIDATFRGNIARYLNHSCDPNCQARIEIVDDAPRIFIYTIRDVIQNEQLTYDYQFKVDTNEKLVCTCKAKNCQGRLN